MDRLNRVVVAGALPVSALAVSVFLAGAIVPSVVRADGCLQQFSCQLYGPCRLPCLDALLGQAPASPQAAAPPVAPMAPAPRRETAKPAVKRVTLARRDPGPDRRLAFVRVVAVKAVTSLDQLAGKPVSFGLEGDPGQIVGRKIFARLRINVVETPLAMDNALDGVASGDIAAVIVVRARDAAKLQRMAATDLHLVPVRDGTPAPTGMTTAMLAPGTAGTLAHGASVRAFAVEAHEMPNLARLMLAAR